MAGAFQDFVRFELPAQGSIGLGDLPRVDDAIAVTGAVKRAGAVDVIERLPEGLSTQLGPSWPGGVDLSGGQWQKVALARGLVREDPLLVVLDEPTSALDAETEHALFERFAEQARVASQAGRVTVLVSHRFSTVRMADLIIVLSGTKVVEFGSHAELMARGATYAELYSIKQRPTTRKDAWGPLPSLAGRCRTSSKTKTVVVTVILNALGLDLVVSPGRCCATHSRQRSRSRLLAHQRCKSRDTP